jgi:hypothetical protein
MDVFSKMLTRGESKKAPSEGFKKKKQKLLASLPLNCHAWESKHVGEWLTSIGFAKYANDFDDIDGADLSAADQGHEKLGIEAWLEEYGLHVDIERTQINRSWEGYTKRWRFSGPSKGGSKQTSLWKRAGVETVTNNRLHHIINSSKTYSCQKKQDAKIKVAHPGDYINIMEVLDLDMTKVRDRTKAKMEGMTQRELLERRKHLRPKYYGTNKRVRQRKDAASAHTTTSPSANSVDNLTLRHPYLPHWKEQPQFVDINEWKSALPKGGLHIGAQHQSRPFSGGLRSRGTTPRTVQGTPRTVQGTPRMTPRETLRPSSGRRPCTSPSQAPRGTIAMATSRFSQRRSPLPPLAQSASMAQNRTAGSSSNQDLPKVACLWAAPK